MGETVYLSLGSNLGDRENNLVKAVEAISVMEGFEAVACSSLYVSQPQEMDEKAPDFLNMALEGKYLYRPMELLGNLQQIEKKLGRADKGGLKPRTIDIDIVLFGNQIIEMKDLSIPHRKMLQREFVLAPLLEIDKNLIHPVTREKISVYYEEIKSKDLTLYKEFTCKNARTELYRH